VAREGIVELVDVVPVAADAEEVAAEEAAEKLVANVELSLVEGEPVFAGEGAAFVPATTLLMPARA
jgi:hypothetical protein